MDFDLVKVREDVTLEMVLRYLRRLEELPDHTDQIFVVDRHDHLRGALPLDRLLINEPEVMVVDAMLRDVLTLHAMDEVDDAAQAFERYDLVSAPVVDPPGPADRPADGGRGGRRDPRAGRRTTCSRRPACARRRTSSPACGTRRRTAGCGWR